MIVYRCKCCKRKYFSSDVLTCEECGGNEFLKENMNTAPPESNLRPVPETINSWSRPNDPIGAVNVQAMSESPCQREQMETAWEDFIFSREDSKVNEYHRSKETEASTFRNQYIPLEPEQLLEHNVLNTISPEIQNIWDRTQTSHLTATEWHRNEYAEASNFSSQHNPSELEQLLNYPIKNHTKINMSFPRFHEPFCQTQASRVQHSEGGACWNSNHVTGSTSSSRGNPQNRMNYYEQSNSDRENHPSIKMMLGEQIFTESSQMNSQDSQQEFSASSASTGAVSQFVPENFIIGHNAIDTQNIDNYYAELFRNSGNSSTENFSLQQGAQSSSSQTSIMYQTGGVENFSNLPSPLIESSASPTPKSEFECEICKKNFTTEFLLTFHMQVHEGRLPFKCNQCGRKFQWESHLSLHRVVHMQEKPFKCSYCDYSSKWKHDVNKHIRLCHKSHLSSQYTPSNGGLKCGKCSRRFKKESAFNAHVTSNCDPKPFKCDQCSEKFPFESSLQRHYRAHAGETPFKCDQCANAFSLKENLKRHKKTHNLTFCFESLKVPR